MESTVPGGIGCTVCTEKLVQIDRARRDAAISRQAVNEHMCDTCLRSFQRLQDIANRSSDNPQMGQSAPLTLVSQLQSATLWQTERHNRLEWPSFNVQGVCVHVCTCVCTNTSVCSNLVLKQ